MAILNNFSQLAAVSRWTPGWKEVPTIEGRKEELLGVKTLRY
jgi:hypothetical protein